MNKSPFFILILFFLLPTVLAEVKPLKEITLATNDEVFISRPGSFIVTQDNIFFIFDSQASNIKIFDETGKLLKVFGRNGLGPDEFVKPFLSAYKEPYICIGDFGRKTFFLYKRLKGSNLQFVQKFHLIGMAYDFHFIDEQNLLVAGYKMSNNNKEYNLYEYNFHTLKFNLVLPIETAYGYASYNKYHKDFLEKLSYIGLFQYCDISKDSIYLVSTADIRIMKIDRKTKEITHFGHKSQNYIQPYLTSEIIRAYNQRKNFQLYKLKNKMSYIRDIFVTESGLIGIVYFGPIKENIGNPVVLQLYNSKGAFISENLMIYTLTGHHNELFSYYKKDNDHLYILETETSEGFDQFHKIYEFELPQ